MTKDELHEAKHQCMLNNGVIILKVEDIKNFIERYDNRKGLKIIILEIRLIKAFQAKNQNHNRNKTPFQLM